jgi:saccharopine dehydrogenase-like NADP-dependent oxidoreductase
MKALLIGCGGIGSNLVAYINKAYENNQIPLDVEMHIADFDTVELKNIRNGQNFNENDLLLNKAKALKRRYDYIARAIPNKITKANLKGYDLIVLAADNFMIRKEVMEYCYEHKKFFIDIRASDRKVFAMYKGNRLQDDLATLDMTDATSGSCQKDTNKLQYGYLIAAGIGIQFLVNYLREDITTRRILLTI